MSKYIPIVVIFGINIFFSFSTLFGYEYDGKESSSIYVIYNIILFLLSLLYFVNSLIIKKEKYSINQILILIIPVIFTFNFLISVLFSNINQSGLTYFLYFILWGVPGIIFGVYLSKNNRLQNLEKFTEIIMLIFSFGIIISSIDSLTNGTRLDIAGASYQTAGYISALAFGINVYYLIYGKKHTRFNFATTKIYRVFCFILLPLQVVGVFNSGGRGAIVLLITYIIYLSCTLIRNKISLKLLIKYFLSLIGILIIISLLFPKLLKIPTFESSFNRVFAYISTDGIDWSGTSGRDVVYGNALNWISESPLFGYGIFGMFNALGYYPHNIFLEVLLQGGIIYLIIAMALLYGAIYKLFKIIKTDSRFRVIFIISLYSGVMLMFSGTYLNTTIFWFCFSIIFSYKINNSPSNKIL